MPYYLAIDAGGTKTHALLANEQIQVLAESKTGPSNFAAVGVRQAKENFRQVVEQVIAEVEKKVSKKIKILSAIVGMAGLDIAEEKLTARQIFAPIFKSFNCTKFKLVNDSWIALESGTQKKDAIILIAGTGSNCLGRASDGRQAKAGGFDYLLSDEGSSYFIGQLALRAAAKSYDGRGQKTKLEALLVKYFQLNNFSQIKTKIYQPALNKSQIAQLAKLVDEAFEQGDIVAKQILDQATAELVLMIKVVAADLDFNNKEFDLVLVGGLFKQQYLKQILLTNIAQFFPLARIIFPQKLPVYGALNLAVKNGV